MSERPWYAARTDVDPVTGERCREPRGWRYWTAQPLVLLVRLYQLLLSPLLGQVCRYHPTCSAYGITALERWGPFTGTWLTMKRLGRCTPWGAGGVDHVPPRPGARPESSPDGSDRHTRTQH